MVHPAGRARNVRGRRPHRFLTSAVGFARLC